MKKKVYRMVSNITILENGDIIFEQKLNAFYVIFFGIGTIFFKSKNKFICNKKEIEKIKQTTSVMTGILITMTTENKIHILEMRGKVEQAKVMEFLKNSELASKIEL